MRYLVILMFLLSSPCFATEYYVDNTSSGTNNGTSWDDAWHGFDDIDWSLVVGGDTVVISGGTSGQTYNITNYIQPGSGESGNNIIIKVGQDEGHNGIVTIDGGDTSQYIFYLQYSDYVTIDGEFNGESHLYLRNWGVMSGAGRYAAVHAYGSAHCYDFVIRYLNIVNDNTSCSTSTCVAEEDIVRRTGIILTGAYDSGCVIEHNYVQGSIRDTVSVGNSSANTFGSNYVRYNELVGYQTLDGLGGPDGVKGIGSTDVNNNTIYQLQLLNAEYNPDHRAEDGVQILAYNCRVYNNFIYGYSQGPVRTDMSDLTQDVYIYNNILYASYLEGEVNQRAIQLDGVNFDNVKIYNNTIVGFYNLGITMGGDGADIYDVDIVNNILFDSDINFTAVNGDYTELLLSNNLVINSDGSHGNCEYAQTHDPYDATKSFEFEHYVQYSEGNDYRLKQYSDMAIDNGEALTLFDTDITETQRPVGDAWDIGAYERDYIPKKSGRIMHGSGSLFVGTGAVVK